MAVRNMIGICLLVATGALVAALGAAGLAPAPAHAAPPQEAAAITPTPTPSLPPAPLLLGPANGSTVTGATNPPLGMPMFTWQLPVIAPYYHIQVSNSPGFSTLLVDSDTRANSYTPIDVWVDGTYYWRVKAGTGTAANPSWGPYSEVFSYVKDWCDGGAIMPQLIKPEENAVRTSFLVGDFSWSPIPGAAGYVFEISADPAFNSVIYSVETLKPQHMPTRRFASNTYYWRVTPFAYYTSASNRVSGTPSVTRAFAVDWSTPPSLLAPADSSNQEFVPRFQWSAVQDARQYRLEISTAVDFNPATAYDTRNTDFTPYEALANDKEYYWRVKAYDQEGNATQWSVVRTFYYKWNFAPRLLTPGDNESFVSYPYFSWEPVPGAEQYEIQIDVSNNFDPPKIASTKVHNVASYVRGGGWAPTDYVFSPQSYYWRVRAIDAANNYTPWSATRSFRVDLTVSPNPVYPPHYVDPDAGRLPVHRAMTLTAPAFVWDTAHVWKDLASELTAPVAPHHYELVVDDEPSFTVPHNFFLQTRTLSAAPTLVDPFVPTTASPPTYYWRVRAYADAGNTEQIGGDVRWIFRFAPPVTHADATAPPPAIIYPREGMQTVETPPMLGWLPVTGASNYRVQISRRPDFATLVDDVRPQYLNYTPWQGHLESEIPAGVYWWRVAAESAPGVQLGGWSTPRSFGVSTDLLTGNPIDFVLPWARSLFSDTATYVPWLTFIDQSNQTTGNDFELDKLHMALDHTTMSSDWTWALAFNLPPGQSQPMRYGIYVDEDHAVDTVDCGGVRPDPLGNNINTYIMHQPEYVIYVDYVPNLSLTARYYRWQDSNGSPSCAWTPAQTIPTAFGQIYHDAVFNAIQLLIPYTALGGADDDFSGSLGVALFSTSPTAPGSIVDAIPDQGIIAGNPTGQIDNLAYVSDMVTPLFPFDTPVSNPIVHYDMPVLRWRMPIWDSVDGYQVQVARDERFSQVIDTWETYETMKFTYFGLMPAAYQSVAARSDNESYYWRVRIRHERFQGNYEYMFDYGPWSPPIRFKLDSRQPTNLALDPGVPIYTTPTFTWNRVEGAAGYTIQIDDDSKFSSLLIEKNVDGTSYTPDEIMTAQAIKSLTTYHWRVRIRRSDSVPGRFTDPPETFVKSSISPVPIAPLTTDPQTLVTEQPTFQWNAVLTPTDTPRLAAPRYRIQVDDDPSFGSPVINTMTEGTSYTPMKTESLDDGQWYWRVAIYESGGTVGPYCTPQSFVKQYPLPVTIWPPPNAVAGILPPFVWQPTNGAAYYKFELANNDSFSSATSVSTVSASYTPTKGLNNGRYFWRVRMYDQDRVPGPIVAGQFNLGYGIYMPGISK